MIERLSAPFLHGGARPRDLLLDVPLALLPPLIIAAYFYGLRVILLALCAVLAAGVCEWLCGRLMKRPALKDGTFLSLGLITALLCPASAPYWLAAAGAAFGAVFGKMVFGGHGRAVFPPAAAGWAFMALSAPDTFFTFPGADLHRALPLANSFAFQREDSVAALLQNGVTPSVSFAELLAGRFAGPMGVTSVLLLFIGALYLAYRRCAQFRASAAFLAVSLIGGVIFPETGDVVTGAVIALAAEGLLFAAVFLLSDPSVTPRTRGGQWLLGTLAGLLTLLFSRVGYFAPCAPLAVLLTCPLSRLCDRAVWRVRERGAAHGR